MLPSERGDGKRFIITRNNMDQFKETAIEAAYLSGKILKSKYGRIRRIEYKGKFNPVTSADRASERAIVRLIRSRFPDHDFLGEEEEKTHNGSAFKWVIDPLDGTVNFSHGYPKFCVSIALEYKGEIVLGVVYDPLLSELFVAGKQKGAFLNGKAIHVSTISDIEKALVATGFSYHVRDNPKPPLETFSKFTLACQAVRRDGCAALNLCCLAAGRIEGYFEQGLGPWDTAAASLIIREAKGKITDYHGNRYTIYSNEILASNSRLHRRMLGLTGTR
jgi:myo-inositol-1(or 4)-monophosphatase